MEEAYKKKSVRHNGYTFVIEAKNNNMTDDRYSAFVTIYKGRIEVGGIGVLEKDHRRAYFPSVEAAFAGADKFIDFATWGTRTLKR